MHTAIVSIGLRRHILGNANVPIFKLQTLTTRIKISIRRNPKLPQWLSDCHCRTNQAESVLAFCIWGAFDNQCSSLTRAGINQTSHRNGLIDATKQRAPAEEHFPASSQQRWSRGHKAWGQGHKKISRPRTRDTDASFLQKNKKRSSKNFFRRKRSSKIFFQAISTWGNQKKGLCRFSARFLGFSNEISTVEK